MPVYGGSVRRVFFVYFVLLILWSGALAEPCLLIYPLQNTIFRYDPARYITVTSGDSSYDPAYGLAGEMLWDNVHNRIAYEVYQAPLLQGFVVSSTGKNEFYTPKTEVTLVIDGFYHAPRRLSDIYVRFTPFPADAFIEIRVNGAVVKNYRHFVPLLEILSVVGSDFYSDTVSLDVEWTGTKQLTVTAFADKNGNQVHDGESCFSVLLEDPAIPTSSTTWGMIKSLYRE
jgi:hypothetical protein